MFEVTIANKKYTNQEIESVAVYSDENGLSHAWVTFKKDASALVGLNISISSNSIKGFTGQIDCVESQTDYICKLYCIGCTDISYENEKALHSYKSSNSSKEVRKRKTKT